MRNYKKNTLIRNSLFEKNGYSLFEKDLNALEDCCNKVKKEFIKIGDAGESNYLWVGVL